MVFCAEKLFVTYFSPTGISGLPEKPTFNMLFTYFPDFQKKKKKKLLLTYLSSTLIIAGLGASSRTAASQDKSKNVQIYIYICMETPD